MKIILRLLTLILLSQSALFGQIDQLTTHESLKYFPASSTHEYLGNSYYTVENETDNIDIFQITEDSLFLVFESSIVLCEEYISCWCIYEDLIIIKKYNSLLGINFLTNEIMFEEEVSYGDIDCPMYIENDLLNTIESDFFFDVRLKEVVPSIKPIYKSDNYYYFRKEEGALKTIQKRIFLDTTSTVVLSDSFFVSSKVIETDLYLFAKYDTLAYKINNTDQLVSMGQKGPYFYTNITQFNDSLLICFGKNGYVDTQASIYNMNSEELIGEFEIPTCSAYNTFFSGSTDTIIGVLGYCNSSFKYLTYNLITNNAEQIVDDIAEISGFSEIINVDDKVYFYGVQNHLFFRIDIISGELINIELPFVELNDYPSKALSLNGKYLHKLITPNGYQLYSYDPDSNSYSNTNLIPSRNSGVSRIVEYNENVLYCHDPYSNDHLGIHYPKNSIDIYGPQINNGILTLEADNIKSKILGFEDNLYFHNKKILATGNVNEVIKYNKLTQSEEVIYSTTTTSLYIKIVGHYLYFSPNINSMYNLTTENIILVNDFYNDLIRNYNKGFSILYSSGYNLYYINNFNFMNPLQIENDVERSFILTENHVLYLKDSIIHYFNGTESFDLLTQGDKSFSSSKYSSNIEGTISTFSYLENGQSTIITFNNQGVILSTLSIDMYIYADYSNANIRMYRTGANNLAGYILINLSNGNIFFSESFTSYAKVIAMTEDEVHFLTSLDEISIFNYELEYIDQYSYSTPEVEGYLLPNNRNEALGITPRPLIWKVYGYGIAKMALLDAKNRTLEFIMECEDDLNVLSYTLKDSTLYFVATNEEKANQLYSYEIENLVTNVSNNTTKKTIEIYPNPVHEFLKFDKPFLEVKVFDMRGRKIIEKANCLEVDVQDFVSGVYYIILFDGVERYTTKFVKQ